MTTPEPETSPAPPPTPAAVRAYCVSGGGHCPYCGETAIEAGRLDAEGRTAWCTVTCPDCGARWQELFTLSAIEVPDPANGEFPGITIEPAEESHP